MGVKRWAEGDPFSREVGYARQGIAEIPAAFGREAPGVSDCELERGCGDSGSGARRGRSCGPSKCGGRSGARGSVEQVVEQTRVVQGQHIEFMGHREHHMEVAGGQEFSLAGRQPTLACLGRHWGSADFCTSCKRWPDVRSAGTHPGGHPVLRCGSAEWPETL